MVALFWYFSFDQISSDCTSGIDAPAETSDYLFENYHNFNQYFFLFLPQSILAAPSSQGTCAVCDVQAGLFDLGLPELSARFRTL